MSEIRGRMTEVRFWIADCKEDLGRYQIAGVYAMSRSAQPFFPIRPDGGGAQSRLATYDFGRVKLRR